MKSNKRRWIVGLLCMALINTWADNVIVKAPMIVPGQNCEISVELENSNQVAACQLFLYLPQGVSLAKDEADRFVYTLSDARKFDHVLTVVEAEDGSYLFAVFSPSNAPLTGSNGELFTVTLTVDDTVNSTVQATYKNIMTSTANGEGSTLPDVTFDLEMGTTTGIQTIQDQQSIIQHFFLLDGCRIEGVPSKKGIYISQGRKLVVRSQ